MDSVRPILLVVTALGTIPLGCSTTLHVPVTDAATEYRDVQPYDCRVYDERKKSLTLGINFVALFGAVSAGPAVQQAETTGIHWNDTVQGIIVRYKELCQRFNAGGMSIEAYQRQLKDVDELEQRAEAVKESANEAIRQRAGTAFADLDRDTGGGTPAGGPSPAASRVLSDMDSLYNDVKSHPTP
jgi:hypothetical protein